MRKILHTLAALSMLLTLACKPAPDSFDLNEFRHPSTTYRTMTFWSLNDSLSADEMRRQLALFKEGGFGGAFFHSRPGLLTPYLSEEWFDMMEAGVQESQKLGLESWFYDEDKWPSGFAGGIVPRQDDAFRARTLVRVPKGTALSPEDSVLLDDGAHLYVSHVDPMGQSWYNGACWVDLMNPDAVKAFIECTYKPYAERFAGRKGVMGIFSDEPQVSPRRDVTEADAFIPYSPCMEPVFKEKYGYELRPHLASLVDTVGDWRTFRLQYYRTVGECMEKAFSRQLGHYCAEAGLLWTGHYNGEELPVSNMFNQGNLMTQFRHMQVPGVDALGLRFKVLHNAKVMTSVANQFGLKRRIVEIFGTAGHNLSFEDRIWLTAWHTNNGLNLFCPHLSHYSLKGIRKYDYPPSFNYQEPYWPDNALFEDYSARLAYFATVGRTAGEVLAFSPLESDYLDRDVAEASPEPVRDQLLEDILQQLMTLHFNADLGDEQIASEIGSVENGLLRMGEMAYHTVILPGFLTIRPTTLALLERFAAQGGKVIVCGGYPVYVDGVPDALEGLKSCSTALDLSEFGAWMDEHVDRAFHLEGPGADKVWTHLRKVDGGTSLQLSNTSRMETVRIRVAPTGKSRHLALLNPLDGECLSVPCADDGSFELEFAPAQTWILLSGDRACRHDGEYRLPSTQTPIQALECWTCKRQDPNALPLDFAEWSTDGGKTWMGPEPVLAIYFRFNDGAAHYDGPMLLRYSFEVQSLPAKCSLVVEQPWMYKAVTLNGHALHFSDDWYVDRYFRTADVAPYLKAGRNEVLLSLDFVNPIPTSVDPVARYGTEIENVFLVGDFAVEAALAADQPTETWRNRNPILNPKPMPARFQYGSFSLVADADAPDGDFTRQGHPFYAGRLSCAGTFNLTAKEDGVRYKITFPKVEAITVGVKVNGMRLPTVFCSPWETDVTDVLKAGENEVELTLTGSLRNLMGPLHCVGGEFAMLGPATFSGRDSWPNAEPGDNDWFDLRKTGKTRLWRDDYFCIPFGLMEAPVLVAENF